MRQEEEQFFANNQVKTHENGLPLYKTN